MTTRSALTSTPLPVLQWYGFTAAFFIQTVTIGKDGFMDAAQINNLADQPASPSAAIPGTTAS